MGFGHQLSTLDALPWQKRIAEHTGQTPEKIQEDSERDRFFDAKAAVAYGICDEVLGEDSPQLKESNKLLQRSMALGFAAAESPFGKQEIILDLEPINSSYYANAVEATLPAQTFSPSADAEDQFAF